MGFLWDLLQQSEISSQRQKATQLEDRLRLLEKELDGTRDLLRSLILRLEQHFGEDIDKDGKIG